MDSMHELKPIVLLTIKCFLKLHQLSWYCCLWCLPWDNNHCEFLPEISNKLGDTWSGTWSFPSLKNISNFFRLLCMWLVLLLTRDWNGHWKAVLWSSICMSGLIIFLQPPSIMKKARTINDPPFAIHYFLIWPNPKCFLEQCKIPVMNLEFPNHPLIFNPDNKCLCKG